MTPKQKAQELYRNTYKKAMQIRGSDLMTEVAKQFSLLTVDETMESLEDLPLALTKEYYDSKKYWQEVKQELEKL